MSQQLDLANFIESKVRMSEFMHFNPDVGVDGIQFIGLPGSGKTSFAQLVCKDLIKDKGENIFMGGDRFCEFRHFFRYPRIIKKITLFLPDNQDLYFHNIPALKNKQPDDKLIREKYGINFESIIINLDDLDVKDFLNSQTEKEIFVIYDNHYQGEYLWKRAELWKNITRQLLERTVLIDDTAITTLYNEAGILWQEGASGKHWKEVNNFSEILVECRKGLVRPIFLSQLETEISHDIRKKLMWKCYRLGATSRQAPAPVRTAAPFLSRSAYILMCGGMYSIGNQTPKLSELKSKWKVIPTGKLRIEEENNKEENKIVNIVKSLSKHDFTQTEIGSIVSLTQPRISQILAS